MIHCFNLSPLSPSLFSTPPLTHPATVQVCVYDNQALCGVQTSTGMWILIYPIPHDQLYHHLPAFTIELYFGSNLFIATADWEKVRGRPNFGLGIKPIATEVFLWLFCFI